MAIQTFPELIVPSPDVAGTLFNTYTVSKSVIPPTSLITLPSQFFYKGKALRFKIRGAISNIVTTPGTITFELKIAGVVVWSSGAIQLNATAHTLLPFTLDLDLVCRAIGSGTAANLMGMGEIKGKMFTATAGQVDGVNSDTVLQAPATAPAVGNGFDSTIANILDLWVGFSISGAGNGIQIHQYLPMPLN